MTTVGFIMGLKKKLTLLEREVGLATETVNAAMTRRIFVDGKSSEGADIGKYDTNPLYVNTEKKAPNTLAPKGKTGKTKFNNGKPHKSTFFQGGYREFRAKQGRPADHVNLDLFGQLESEFGKPPVKTGELTWEKSISNPANIDKINGARAKYGDGVFKLSKKERALFTRLSREAFIKVMK